MAQRINNRKTTADGGRVNPKTVPDGYESPFAPMSDEELHAAMIEARDVATAVHQGVEWEPGTVIGDFMERWTGSAEMSPILLRMLEGLAVAADTYEVGTWAQAAAMFVEMDHPAESATALIDYANENEWEIRSDLRRCEAPDVDFITRQIHSLEFMLTGLSDAMDVGFIEKSYQEDKGHPRPEEYFDDVGPISTPYVEGCPCHNERLAGHGIFCGWLARRAKYFYNGEDAAVDVFFKQVAFSRVLSFMHIAQSCDEGFRMADEGLGWMARYC